MQDSNNIPTGNTVTIILAGFQWLFFIFVNVVVVPVSIGQAFHLPLSIVSLSIERAFIYTGIACLLQATVGHRLPLMEGPAGLWWGVILSLAASTESAGQSLQTLGSSIGIGIILSGIFIILWGVLGLGWVFRRIFTPSVTATFYFLLAVQLTQLFFKGMIGLDNSPIISVDVALLSLGIVTLVLTLNMWGRGLISNFAPLIGIIVGWIAFSILFPRYSTPFSLATPTSWLLLFPWGTPTLNFGFIVIIVLIGFISITNTYVTLEGAEKLFHTPISPKQYKYSFVITGFSTIVAGIFGLVPYGPYASSLGFLRTTRILSRKPFFIGAGLFMLLGAIPALGQLLASLPLSMGDAVLFTAYLQLFGLALDSVKSLAFSYKHIYRIAVPVLLGLSLMAVPAPAFSTIPAYIRPLLQNGLVVGIILAMLLEHSIRWEQKK